MIAVPQVIVSFVPLLDAGGEPELANRREAAGNRVEGCRRQPKAGDHDGAIDHLLQAPILGQPLTLRAKQHLAAPDRAQQVTAIGCDMRKNRVGSSLGRPAQLLRVIQQRSKEFGVHGEHDGVGIAGRACRAEVKVQGEPALVPGVELAQVSGPAPCENWRRRT